MARDDASRSCPLSSKMRDAVTNLVERLNGTLPEHSEQLSTGGGVTVADVADTSSALCGGGVAIGGDITAGGVKSLCGDRFAGGGDITPGISGDSSIKGGAFWAAGGGDDSIKSELLEWGRETRGGNSTVTLMEAGQR